MRKIIPVTTDHLLQESIRYPDPEFPFSVWIDRYENFEGHMLNCHWHDDPEYDVVLEGAVEFQLGDHKMVLEKGDCVFVNSNTMHLAKQIGEKPAVLAAITFSSHLFQELLIQRKYVNAILQTPVQGFLINRSSSLQYSLEKLAAADPVREGYELTCISHLCQVIRDTFLFLGNQNTDTLILRLEDPAESLVRKMIQYMKAHYAEPFTIEALSEELHASRSVLFRRFSQFTGKRPMEYLMEYRLEQAAKLLEQSTLTVSEVGMTAGFSTSSYFGKCFKERYRMTPLKYRKECVSKVRISH